MNVLLDRMSPNHDIPFGTYKIKTEEPFLKGDKAKYGQYHYLQFEPIKGLEDEADKSGRNGMKIHGGPLKEVTLKVEGVDGKEEEKKVQRLDRTSGCIRVSDADAKRLYDWWVGYEKENPNIDYGRVFIV